MNLDVVGRVSEGAGIAPITTEPQERAGADGGGLISQHAIARCRKRRMVDIEVNPEVLGYR